MTIYILDTNIISDLVRNPQGRVMQNIEKVGEENISTSIVVAAELRFGAAKKGSPPLTERIEALLSRIKIRPLEKNVDTHYAEIRTDLEAKGTPIGANDLWIAAHVRQHSQNEQCTLVTANKNEFERVAGIVVENWLD